MKNIHVLTTGKPSRLLRGIEGIRLFEEEVSPDNGWCVNVNICITSDEEIKEGDPRINNYQRKLKGEEIPSKKIILTTNKLLIKDGVQSIDDEFIEWFVKNPSCESVEFVDDTLTVKEAFKLPLGTRNHKYKIIIPKEEFKQLNPEDFGLPQFGTKEFNDLASQCFGGKPKQETLEEASERIYQDEEIVNDYDISGYLQSAFLTGAKWQQEQYTIEEQHVGHTIDELDKEYIKGFNEGSAYQQERMYSEEDMKNAFDSAREFNSLNGVVDVHIVLPMGGDMSDLQPLHFTFDEWFNEFKKK